MKRNTILLLAGLAFWVAAIFSAFDDHLSEVAPAGLVLGAGCFAWLLYRRMRPPASGTAKPVSVWLKISAGLAVAGLAGLAVSVLSCLDPALTEFGAAGLAGALLLIFALVARIADGMLANRVDAATGGLSIVAIFLLLGGLVVACGLIYFGYLLLNW